MLKVRKGSGEEIPFVQGKEQQLCFAGAAVRDTPHPREEIPHTQGKRNPSKMVGVVRGHQRADTLKPNHRQLVNLITWTTALSNSLKLSHMWGTQDRQVMVERSDRMWSTGEGNGKPLQYSCLENPNEQYEKAK